MHRFYVPADSCLPGDAQLPAPIGRQLVRVLRARSGERIALFPGDGTESIAEVRDIHGEQVHVRVSAAVAVDRESPISVTVIVALLKGEKLDWVAQKLTELGASRLLFVPAARSISALDGERVAQREERLRRIATEAAEQSGRTRLPEVRILGSVDAALADTDAPYRFMLAPGSQPSLVEQLPAAGPTAVLVGPEGGWTEPEVTGALRRGWLPVGMGPRVLRAETAAIAAAALLTLTQR